MPPKRKKPSDTAAAPKKKTPRVPKVKPASSEVVKLDVPWPPHFKELERVHRALNLVYTFCCTRKQLATTFDNLRSAVEGHTKKELTVTDIAQIKFVVPKSIHFEYVDEEMLQVYVAGGASAARDQAYSMIPERQDDDLKEVLLFEFVDGDLKRSVARKINKSDDPKKPREVVIKPPPSFSTAQMTKLISKRNTKFASAVNAFLNECAEAGEDPVESIKKQYHPHVPVESKTCTSIRDERGVIPPEIPPEIPKERKSIPEIIEEIKASSLYTGQIVENGHRIFDPQEPIYGDLNFLMSQHLVNALYTARNITRLYSHQADAINNLHDGHHVIVSTSTSSGKSLIYQIPVLHELEHDKDTRAMFIFPTKALAQDQKRSLIEVLSYMTEVLGHISVNTFDGDTPREERKVIRDEASVIFTNPDMLHLNILPNEDHWRMFLKNLKFVVVDELHVYNGLFGSHVALIMRRLRRICSALGNNKIRFISCSATVANPEAHMRTIFGIDSVKLTEEDGSPSGRKEFLCWNTPYKDSDDPTSGRADSIAEAARIFTQLVLRGVRTIAFCRVRNACELMLQAVRAELQRLERSDVVNMVMGYRGGYTPQDRRRIEKEMFEGLLMGIVATNALELGVDIGSLDAVIIVNFPYNISNLRQQSGRAGRRKKDSLSILVGGSFPIDQHYMAHPDEIFLKPNLALSVDLENILTREGHIQCAAHEMPIEPLRDRAYFGSDLPAIAAERLIKDNGGFYHSHPNFNPYPSRHVAIRNCEESGYAIVDVTNNRNVVLEEIEPSRAIFILYEGGIFLHQGRSYLVRSFSQEESLARVEAVNVNWTTSCRDFTDVDPIETELVRHIPESKSKAFFGKIRITSVVFGFFKLDKHKRILDAVEVENRPLVLSAKGFWIDIPRSALDIIRAHRMNAAAAVHAAEHAVMSLFPSFLVGATSGDELRTECKAPEKEFAQKETSRKRPARLIFYDRTNAGTSKKAFEFVFELLKRAVERVEGCKACVNGCPECCCGERCREGNAVVSKHGAAVVLRCILGWEIDESWLAEVAEEGERGWDGGKETVIPADEVGGRAVVEIKEESVEESSRFANCIS